MDNNPIVTVYITTHNRRKKMLRAFYSVMLQSYSNIEIVITDDGSSDDTQMYGENLAQKYKNVIYIRNDKPKGANSARNNALRVASGSFITGLDDDDVFKNDRINKFISNWNEQYAFLCDNLKNQYVNSFKNDFIQKGNVTISKKDMLLINNATNQVFTKLDYLKNIGGFNESLKKFQDWDCWLRLSDNYGEGLRLNNQTYIMYHDEEDRVSKRQKNEDAYYTMVNNNINIYLKYYSYNFINKYLLENKNGELRDVISCKTRKEVLKVLRRNKTFRFLKNKLDIVMSY
ncbi:glycosyltransferase [Aliivibrio fischeri]|uniref:glycosyltransferase n=1 Tax=Aliivibrio fischeri TaxID=668 RepID=UPI0012D85B21|nr:glycosyltransferase [Aliivibrio fischeri]MUK92266.1 glycosyltransferase [Aliivibrio fischeri]